jgi:hypothetical protein
MSTDVRHAAAQCGHRGGRTGTTAALAVLARAQDVRRELRIVEPTA